MNKLILYSFLIFLDFAVVLYGEIIECQHFSELCDHVDPETLIVLDIDDTLLIPVQMLGCDEWFQRRFKENKSTYSPETALDKTLAEWEAIRQITKMEIVESGTEKIIATMQDKKYCVMGLTTQGLTLSNRTERQLREKGIDLLVSAPSKEDHYFCLYDHGVLYRKGILFTCGQPKGEALFKLCDNLSYRPKKIVFINDKRIHLEDIEKAAEARNIPFVGLRYAYSDARKAAFDETIANYQFKRSSFNTLISDQEARESIQMGK